MKHLIKSLLLLTCLLGLIPAEAADCRKTGSVCVDGPSTKVINGATVTRDCWQFTDTYECVDPSAIDSCTTLKAAGCGQTNSTCVQTAFNGACLDYQNTFGCTAPVVPIAAGVTQLPTTYTIVSDKLNESTCGPLSLNTNCTKTGRRCVEGPATRNINGLDVTEDCWRYEDDYSCLTPQYVNYCQALAATPACKIVSDVCGQTAPDGSCNYRTKVYDCSATQAADPNIIILNDSYTITSDTLDMAQCQNYASSPNCALASETCVEGPATRNINGLDVYKDCWRFERTYTCASTTLTSNCQDLISRGCTQTASNCKETLPSGDCGLWERVYQCKFKDGSVTDVTNCNGQVFCDKGNCFDTGYTPDGDFALAATAKEAGREAGVYLDPNTLTLFNGVNNTCRRKLGSAGNCCDSNPNSGTSNAAMGVTKTVSSEVVRMGSAYVYDALFNGDNLSMIGNGVNAMMGNSPFGSSSTMSFYGATFDVSANGVSFVSFDPYSFAAQIVIMVIVKMLECDAEEKVLAMKRGQNLCEYVGEWCGAKNPLGGCLKTVESYCCYNSRLAKILNVSGKKQLGLTYGDPHAPQCQGFTGDQLSKLDFGAMDLSEFYAEIVSKMPDIAFRAQKNSVLMQKRINNYYSGGNQNLPVPTYP
jgi:conjugal transfer mating pair stabilization protein TraN